MLNFLRSYLIFLMFILPWHVNAASLLPTSELGTALKRMEGAQGFSTQFKQVLTYASGGKRVYEGQLSVLKPGKFRWQYLKPYAQLYVSNGDGIWLYEPDLLQAQLIQDLGDVDPVVMQLLDGRIHLSDVDVVQKENFEAGFSSWQVRIGQGNQSVEAWLGVQNKQLIWIESRDVLSNRNRLNFMDLHFKQPAADIFEFTAPEGVDVIGAKQ